MQAFGFVSSPTTKIMSRDIENHDLSTDTKARWLPQLCSSHKGKRGDAIATEHLIGCTGLDTGGHDSCTIPTSSIWHSAMTTFIRKLSNEDRQAIVLTKDDSALTVQSLEKTFKPLLEKHQQGTVMKAIQKFESTLQHVRSFATIVDVAIQSHPNVACLIWGGIRLILEVH